MNVKRNFNLTVPQEARDFIGCIRMDDGQGNTGSITDVIAFTPKGERITTTVDKLTDQQAVEVAHQLHQELFGGQDQVTVNKPNKTLHLEHQQDGQKVDRQVHRVYLDDSHITAKGKVLSWQKKKESPSSDKSTT